MLPANVPISSLTKVHVANLQPADVQSLSPSQIASIPSESLTTLNGFVIGALSVTQVAALTLHQLSMIPAYSFKGFTAAQLSSLTPLKLNTLLESGSASDVSWKVMNLAVNELTALKQTQVASLSDKVFGLLSDTQFSAFTPTQLSAINTVKLANLLADRSNVLSSVEEAILAKASAGNTTLTLTASDVSKGITLADGGGTDTINTSGLGGNQTINLLAGKASSFGTIAKNTTIENAISGAGHDTLIGNNSNNVLTGNAGNDTFISSKGLDYIQGGAGLDTLEVNAALSWGDSLTAVKQSATTVNLVSEITGQTHIQITKTATGFTVASQNSQTMPELDTSKLSSVETIKVIGVNSLAAEDFVLAQLF